MAKTPKLVHPSSGEEVSLNDPMPPAEPGHKGETLGGGDVFDPNAALRYKQGIGPGLQDSERANPAHWPQLGDESATKAAVEREAERLEKQAKKIRESVKGDNVVMGAHVGEADLRGETKPAK